MKLLLVIVLIVVVVGVIYFRAVAPWMAARYKRKKNKQRKKNKRKNIRDMHSYIKSTGEFDFSRLMNNAGAPMVLSYRSPGIFRLPEKRGYLKMVYSRDGVLDELYALKPPFFRKKIWEKAEEHYFCFFYISGSSIGVKARKLYLNYDAICVIYNEVKKST